ncbi:uncharacterized protein Bfra_005933 [Botrytis fragariae]|uniref:Uncharacterized protein n=1 Tax=Botrytis fragariae TaxID=1964551 RepID=A0A8H6AS15_9HELO|nr:uncharacterized protein Bfra_005933 [Botrytis fragariae]KAF5872572.1 hypothetical protein Bfra_005933 [Botrytis fragariae]
MVSSADFLNRGGFSYVFGPLQPEELLVAVTRPSTPIPETCSIIGTLSAPNSQVPGCNTNSPNALHCNFSNWLTVVSYVGTEERYDSRRWACVFENRAYRVI